MKRTSLFLMSLLTLFCIPIVGSAQDDKATHPVVSGSGEETKRILDEEARKQAGAVLPREIRQPQPDTSSDDWKELADDVGLMVFTDGNGVTRGTLYVRRYGQWHPIAVEGISELGPGVVPASR